MHANAFRHGSAIVNVVPSDDSFVYFAFVDYDPMWTLLR